MTTAKQDGGVLAHVLRTLWREVFNDHASMMAAGLAYYAILGLLPALAAAAALWALVGDPAALQSALHGNGAVLPPSMVQLLMPFLTSVPRGFGGGMALTVNLLLVVWTATRAAGGLLTALNVVYDVKETRAGLPRWLTALGLGVGGIVILFVTLALVALVPLLADWLQSELHLKLLWLRWPAVVGVFAAMLALLFRFGPNRTGSRAVPLCWGVGAGTLLCLLASGGISLYLDHVANFGRLYGSLGGIAAALLWLYGCALSLLVGAEIDAVLTERLDGRGRRPG